VVLSCTYAGTSIAPIWVINGIIFDTVTLMASSLYNVEITINMDENTRTSTLTALNISTTTDFSCRFNTDPVTDSENGTVTVAGMSKQ